MKIESNPIIIGLLLMVAGTLGDQILRNDFDGPAPDGSYRWALQTEGGIYHEQRGSLQPGAAGVPALVVEGQYQYTAPDGQIIHVLYRADENGFHPVGNHIPAPSNTRQPLNS